MFSRLIYPDRFINHISTSRVIAVNASDQPISELPAVNNELNPVGVVLPISTIFVIENENYLKKKKHEIKTEKANKVKFNLLSQRVLWYGSPRPPY